MTATAPFTGTLLDKHKRPLADARVVMVPLSGATRDASVNEVYAAVVSATTDDAGKLTVPGESTNGVPLVIGEQYQFRAPGASNVLPNVVFTMTGPLDLADVVAEPVDLPASWHDTIDALRNLTDPVFASVLAASIAEYVNEHGGEGGPGLVGPYLPAAQTLSGHRLVTTTADGTGLRYADQTRASDLTQPVWLTVTAVAAGAVPDLAVAGKVDEPSWTWTPGARLFLGANGVLTTTPPTTGYLRVVGSALDSNSIWLDPQPALVLT